MSRLERGARVVEFGVASALTLVIFALHVNVLNYAGPLWRDEISSLNLAIKPTLHEFWAGLTYDPAPALFFALLRIWHSLGWAQTDEGLRCLGFAIGLGIIAALWLTSWQLKKAPPTWSLLLLGLSPVTFVWGDSLRAYGLSCFWHILTIGLIWRLLTERPRTRDIVFASVAALCSVHSLFANALLLLAAGSCAIIIALWRRWYASASAVLCIGAGAAISLLPYLPTIRRTQEWSPICRTGIDYSRILAMLFRAVSVSGRLSPVIWMTLTLLLGLAVVFAVVRPTLVNLSEGDRTLLFFAGGTLLVSFVTIVSFIRLAGWPTSIWYYLPLMGSAAVCLDAITRIIPERAGARAIGSLCAGLAAAFLMPLPIQASHIRLTNIDLTAAMIARHAGSSDLVVVNNFFYSISFQRYYHGAAPCLSLPSITDLSLHRWDLLKQRMTEVAPNKSILDRIDETLRAGHAVYVVGCGPVNRASPFPPDLPPAPLLPTRWNDSPYLARWQLQVAYTAQTHSTQAAALQVPCDQPVNVGEAVNALVFHGWKPPTVAARQ